MQITIKPADFLGSEFNDSDCHGIDGIIAADADILARVPLGPALADYDIANLGGLAAKFLDA